MVFRRAIKLFFSQFEYSIILVGAAAIAVLSLLDVISDVKPLVACVLATLSLLAFAILRQNARRAEEVGELNRLSGAVAVLSERFGAVRSALSVSQRIDLLSDIERQDAFATALSDPILWHFRGMMGSYLRSTTLESVARSARRRAGTRSLVTVQILDPSNSIACERYASYRKDLAEGRSDASAHHWTSDRVRLECLASVLAVCWYYQHEGLDIRLALLNRMLTIRVDASEVVAFLTNEDRDLDPLAVPRSERWYFALIRDLEITFEDSRQLDLRVLPRLPRQRSSVSSRDVRQIADAVGASGLVSSEEESRKVIKLAFEKEDTYSYSSDNH